MNPGCSQRRVKDIVLDFTNGELAIPDYQREYCWQHNQAQHFIGRTLKIGHVLGAITTYTLLNGTTVFLQDGLQRVTTLRNAQETPSKFGLSEEDVKILRSCDLSQQAMIYESHDEARQDFQHLNQGLGLIAYEKYRGDLEKDDAGKRLYGHIRTNVNDLSIQKAGCSRASAQCRKKAGQLHRNSLGLFYQHCTSHTETQLYVKSENSLKVQIERRVRVWLDNNLQDWENKANKFIRNLERVNALLEEKTSRYTPKQWDLTAVRSLYAANIYAHNIGCTTDYFDELVDWFVFQNVNRKKWSARFDVDVEGTKTPFRMDQVSLKWLPHIETLGGPKIVVAKRVKSFVARAGYDESHITPHADGGTETFSEPSITNRARGRLQVDVGDEFVEVQSIQNDT